MGTRSKFTPERAERILGALRAGNTRANAAALAAIDITTLWRWMGRHANFAKDVEAAEAEAEAFHVAVIVKAASEGIWTASAWYLERRSNHNWGRRDRVEIVNTVRAMAAEAGLTDDEQAEAAAEAERYLQEIRSAGSRR